MSPPDRQIVNESVDKAMPLVVAAVAAFCLNIPAVVSKTEVVFLTKERTLIVDSVAPCIRSIHRQCIVQPQFPTQYEPVVDRISLKRSKRYCSPVRLGENMFVR